MGADRHRFVAGRDVSGGFSASLRGRRPAPPDGLARARRWFLLGLLVAVAVVMDRRTPTVYGLPKFSVLVVGVAVAVAAAVGEWVVAGRRPRWATGLHRPVLALVAWTGLSTATGVNPAYSVLGDYFTLDGLVTAVVLAALFFSVADVVRARDLKTVATVLYLGAGGPVVAYGAVQLSDRLGADGGGWIVSTFGNPNHLGGFLAMLVPLGLVLFVSHRAWWARVPIALVAVAAVVELAYTTSRGAWLAALMGVAALAALTADELRRRPRLVAALAAGGLAAGILGAVAVGPGDAGRHFASIFDPGGRTTVERTEYWRAAWRMAADRPLVGVGPDAYILLFNRYQTPRYVAEFAVDNTVNGPHSIFFTHLAGGGFPQLALFVAVLVVAGRQARAAVGELAERGPPGSRLLLAGVAAATVAIVVHSAFDVQELFLSVWVWALLGVVSGAAADVLRTDERPSRPRPWIGAPAALAAGAGVVLAGWLAVTLYRADVDAGRGDDHFSLAYRAAVDGDFDRARSEGAVASRHYDRAMALYPRSARYPAARAVVELSIGEELWRSGDDDDRAEGRAYLERARRHARRTIELTPQAALPLRGYAAFLQAITELGAADHSQEMADVVGRAMAANPLDRTLFTMLAQARLRTPSGSPP